MFPTVPPLSIEEVGKGLPWRQFADLALAFGGGHAGVEWLLAGQRRRLRALEPPGGQAALLLARRDGRPIARLSAHRLDDGSGAFGFLAVEGPDDGDAVRALLKAASEWLAERGSTTVLGPLSWTAAEEAGVLVAGHDQPAATGRAWNPPWYGDLLEGAGLEVAEEMCSYRLATTGADDTGAAFLTPAPFAVSPDVAAYADPALLLAWPEGDGSVVAVPDVAGGLAGAGPAGATSRSASGRRAWSLARQARRRDWAGCVVTAVDGPESVLIPGLCAAAGRAGYQWVLSPWAPTSDEEPVMRHRLYRADVASLLAP